MYVYCNVFFPHIYIQTSYSQNHFLWNLINLPAIITIIFRFPILSETIPIIIELKEKVKCIPYIINFTSQYLIFKCIFNWSKHDIWLLNWHLYMHSVPLTSLKVRVASMPKCTTRKIMWSCLCTNKAESHNID